MIRIAHLNFGFAPERPVVAGLDLIVESGRTAALLGPSGCGKSTVLRLVAGLLTPQAGTLALPSHAAGQRTCGLVFQDPRLLPWLTVEGNLHFALRAAGVPKREWSERITPLLERVGLAEARALRPRQLSGGMAQRVAVVRALALHPRVLLLDEPFGAVDPLLRESLQALLQELVHERDVTTLLVTHDIGEALVLGDEVAVLGGPPLRVLHTVRTDPKRVHMRPRSEGFRLSTDFQRLQAEVRGVLAAERRSTQSTRYGGQSAPR